MEARLLEASPANLSDPTDNQAQGDFARALLQPCSVALVGVSGDAKKNTARPLLFMRKHGYGGKIYPVNPSRKEVLGERAYPSLDALPEPVDHVFIMVPGAQVAGLLEQCAAAGAKVVTIYSDGFGETGEEGMRRQAALLEQARALGLRLLGPNSIGLADIPGGGIISVNAAFTAEDLVPGHTSMVSQSGSMMGSLLSRAAARGFGFAKSVSVGNECDISVGEVLDALVDDSQTRSIILFLETIRNAPVLAAALRRAHAAGKPVIVYKLGRSEQGNALSQSHTGAIAGNDAAVDAFFREHGAIRVHVLETLFEILPLAERYGRAFTPVHGRNPRLAIITTTGGGAATVVDAMGLLGLDAIAPPPEFIAHMSGRGLTLRSAPVIDLTLAATSAQYKDLLEQLLQAPWCDAVLSVAGSSAQFHPDLAVRPLIESARPAEKPLAAFLAPEAPTSLKLLHDAGIAAFRTPESCADALAAFLKRDLPSGQNAGDENLAWPDDLPVHGLLNEHEAGKVLDALGVARAASQLLSAQDLQHQLGYPLVVKVCSRDIPHKTEAGGVRVGIHNRQELEQQTADMLRDVAEHCPDARVEGVLVQSMEQKLIELILGYRNDPLVGPTVVLGAGGITAELNRDFAIRMAPVDLETARAMIRQVRLTRLIEGFRGLPRGDVEALARTISDFSRLAHVHGAQVEEAEINPLFVRQDGVVAVDALIRLA